MTVPDSITVFRDLGAVGVVCVSFILVLRHTVIRQSEQMTSLTEAFRDYCNEQSRSLRRVTASMAFLARSIVGLEEVVLTNTELWKQLNASEKNGQPLNEMQRMSLETMRRIESILSRQQNDLTRIAGEIRDEPFMPNRRA